MRNILRLMLSLMFCIIAITCFAVTAYAAQPIVESGACGTEGNNVTWILYNDGTLAISGVGEMANYTSGNSAPWYNRRDSIKTLDVSAGVTHIGDYAFYQCENIEGVTFSPGLSSIGSYAFSECSGLIDIIIPPGVMSISDGVFYRCSSLQTVSIPYGVTTIPYGAFKRCSNLERVSIPESVTAIETDAFYEDGKLSDVVLPDGLKTIGFSAFQGCTSLEEINLPDGLAKIENYAFDGCGSLKEIIIPESVTLLFSRAFSNCSGLTEITIPGSIKNIASYCFSSCSSLQVVEIQNGVETIDFSAFGDCNSLTTVILPVSLTSINSTAFPSGFSGFYCYSGSYAASFAKTYVSLGSGGIVSTSFPNQVYWTLDNDGILKIFGHGEVPSYTMMGSSTSKPPWSSVSGTVKEVIIEEGVTSIGAYAFYACSPLTSVVLADGVISIGNYIFSNCISLADISLPDTLTSIGNDAFSGCSALQAISIPSSVRTIADSTFSGCNRLANIDFQGKITSIGISSFSGCSRLSEIILPDGLAIIEDNAFNNCYSLKNLNLPESLTTIGSQAFSSCSSLDSVVLPDSVTSIGAGAFRYCSFLDSVSLPSNLTSLPDNMFQGCSALEFILIPSNVETIGGSTFRNCSSLQMITLPDTCSSIGERAFAGCTNLLTVDLPYYNNGFSIGTYAFQNCSSLRSFKTPEDVLILNTGIFSGCSSLSYVTTGLNCQTISSSAFANCTALEKVIIECDYLKSISKSAFNGCNNLTIFGYSDSYAEAFAAENNIPFSAIEMVSYGWCGDNLVWYIQNGSNLVISGSGDMWSKTEHHGNGYWTTFLNEQISSVSIDPRVTSIGDDAFSDLTNVSRFDLPQGLTRIGEGAFLRCSAMHSLLIPETVTEVGAYAFTQSGLESLTIPSNITGIPDYLFSECSNLISISLPNSIASVGDYSFVSCSNLRDAYYDGTLVQWNAMTVGNGNEALSSATLHCIHSISIADIASGTVMATIDGVEVEAATEGKNVVLIPTPAEGYKLGVISYNDGSNHAIEVDESGVYSFIMPNKDVTVTANFHEVTYSIVAEECVNGIISTTITSAAPGDTVQITITPNTGYELADLNVTCNGMSVPVIDKQFTMPKGDVLISAVFTRMPVITFDPNGGIGNMPPTKVGSASASRLPPNIFLRQHYFFTSWNTNPYGTGISYVDEDTITTTTDIVLYAQWERVSFNVFYDANGGLGTMESQTVNEGESCILSENKYIKEGCLFAGWNTKSDGSGIRYEDCAIIPSNDISKDMYLYAQWDKAAFTVFFDANGGDEAPAYQRKARGEEIALTTAIPSRNDWYFIGWAENPRTCAVVYLPGDRYTIDADMTLYAVWAQPNISLPSALTVVEDEAFTNCIFRFVELPAQVVSIGWHAFANCPNLAYIYIPASTTQIDDEAFGNMQGLTILGKTGTTAETYARNHNFNFIAVP